MRMLQKYYKNTIQLDFESSNNEKYKVRRIWNSMIYAKKLEIVYLLEYILSNIIIAQPNE